MNTPRAAAPRVMLVGAYNMDSLGDLLLLLVTEHYLGSADVVAAAPLEADMTAILGRRVPAFGPLLQRQEFDVIWTVGGGIEGLDLEFAYSMSAGDAEYGLYRESSPAQRVRILRRLAGDEPIHHAYIPSPLAHPLNRSAITVINSVGIAHALGSGYVDVPAPRREAIASLLRGTTFVSVRDKESGDVLTGLGVEHSLAPDAVHAVSALQPGRWNPASDVAIFQIKSGNLATLGVDNVAAALAGSAGLRGMRIRILLSGVHRGIDSFEEKADLVRRVKDLAPSTDVELITERRPLELAARIRDARIVVGDSHHMRVVASAYKVPRVSLNGGVPLPIDKLTRYMRTWDSGMPFDISLDELDGAVARAFVAAEVPAVLARSDELTVLASRNLSSLATCALTMASTQTAAERAERVSYRRRQSDPAQERAERHRERL